MCPDVQPGPEDPDADCMRRLREEDAAAFSELVARYQQEILNFFHRLGVHQDGEDLVQATFLKVYRHRRRYRPRAKFRTWLYTIARRVWIDHVRQSVRRRARMQRLAEDPSLRAVPASDPPEREVQVRQALDRLPEKLKLVVVMSVYQDMKYQEIGEALGIPEGTVKSRMHLAMRQLKEWLS